MQVVIKKVAVLSCLNEFILPIRVYYEDTDAGGIVYHANYLKFMERARTEWLRSFGVEQDILAQQGFLFVLSQLSINYRKPALFNEQIYVSAMLTECQKASMLFTQQVWRQNSDNARELLADASVKVVCITQDTRRPTPLPPAIRNLIP
jgi:acyl-CoA thioester hydrolase